MAFRLFTLIAIFGLLFGLLGYGLYRLQIEKSPYYAQRAETQIAATNQLVLRRGQIFFTNRANQQVPAAFNRDYPAVYAVPKDIKDPVKTSAVLAPVISWPEANLATALNNPKSLFKLLVDKISPEVAQAVTDLSLPGIYINNKQYRFYPYNNLASQLLGFVGLNEKNPQPVGLYGVEKKWDVDLSAGKNLNLTVDRDLEAESDQILTDLVNKFKAAGGTIIIQEPQTGKILAMVNKPDFNPNDYKNSTIANFINPSVQSVYEPGSVMKPITMAAGIDLGAITPETTYVDKGEVTLNGKTIKNWDLKAHGKITMTNVIEDSVNTGVVFVESQIGNANFLTYLKKFGFGDNSGIDLPDEVAGSLRNLEKKALRQIDFATAAFGQGVAVTPVQLITAFSSLANGGLLMKPYINVADKPQVVRRVISEETSKKVVKMMQSAVEKAHVASIPGYQIAGKTGTAYIPDFKNGGYSNDFVHTYVGFAPVTNPKFVILLKLEKPQAELAGLTVVPAFHDLAQFVLNYYNVPPDNL